MEQVYLDINGDILNDIFDLKGENCVDNILKDIVNNNGGKKKTNTKDKKAGKKKDKKKSKKKYKKIKMTISKIK